MNINIMKTHTIFIKIKYDLEGHVMERLRIFSLQTFLSYYNLDFRSYGQPFWMLMFKCHFSIEYFEYLIFFVNFYHYSYSRMHFLNLIS